jgi:hypothetical protein
MDRQVTVLMPTAFYNVLRDAAAKDYTTVSTLIRNAIMEQYRDRIPPRTDAVEHEAA